MTRRTLLLALAAVSACGGNEGGRKPAGGPIGGTIAISASADADALVPPLTFSVQGKQVVDQIFDALADVGSKLNTIGDEGFTPRLARSWRWSPDSLSIDFSLDPRARWHDGAPVRSDDVRFTYALVKDTTLGSPLAGNLENVDSVTTPDSLTARVWFHVRQPDQFFKAATPVPILPAHLLKGVGPASLRTSPFAQHPVGSGRFRFSSWERGARIALVADSDNYRGRPNADRVVWLVAADYPAAIVRFLTGSADFIDAVKPDYLERARQAKKEIVATDGSLDYGYLAFNVDDKAFAKNASPLSDRTLRRALVMAVDRNAIVRNVFGPTGLVAHAPATRVLPTNDSTGDLPYDSAAAARALDSLGWKRGANGMRQRARAPLAFSLMIPSSSSTRNKLAVLLQEQWRRAGVAVTIDPLEANTFGARLQDRKFEAAINAWHIDPTPSSVREEWASSEIKKGGYNETSYRNAAFDAEIDSAVSERDPARSVALYRRAYATLSGDAPAMWIYELRNVYGVSPRIHVTGLRPDAWWANLADWSVTAGR